MPETLALQCTVMTLVGIFALFLLISNLGKPKKIDKTDKPDDECTVCGSPIPKERAGKDTCCELHELLSYSEEELMRDE